MNINHWFWGTTIFGIPQSCITIRWFRYTWHDKHCMDCIYPLHNIWHVSVGQLVASKDVAASLPRLVGGWSKLKLKLPAEASKLGQCNHPSGIDSLGNISCSSMTNQVTEHFFCSHRKCLSCHTRARTLQSRNAAWPGQTQISFGHGL